MDTTVSKGLKPYILKAIIVSMSLLYIFGPVHVEVNKLLHTIVHSLEMPDYILSHQDVKENISKVATHESEDHKNIVKYHDHKVIAFLDKILEGSDQSRDSSDVYVTVHKIDKHINNYEYDLKDEVLIAMSLEIRHRFSNKKKSICKGYLRDLREPPKA